MFRSRGLGCGISARRVTTVGPVHRDRKRDLNVMADRSSFETWMWHEPKTQHHISFMKLTYIHSPSSA